MNHCHGRCLYVLVCMYVCMYVCLFVSLFVSVFFILDSLCSISTLVTGPSATDENTCVQYISITGSTIVKHPHLSPQLWWHFYQITLKKKKNKHMTSFLNSPQGQHVTCMTFEINTIHTSHNRIIFIQKKKKKK